MEEEKSADHEDEVGASELYEVLFGRQGKISEEYEEEEEGEAEERKN